MNTLLVVVPITQLAIILVRFIFGIDFGWTHKQEPSDFL